MRGHAALVTINMKKEEFSRSERIRGVLKAAEFGEITSATDETDFFSKPFTHLVFGKPESVFGSAAIHTRKAVSVRQIPLLQPA